MSDREPYQLGRLRTADGAVFTGVCIDEQVVPLAELGLGTATVEELLADWPTSGKALDAAVDDFKKSFETHEGKPLASVGREEFEPADRGEMEQAEIQKRAR